MSTTLNIAAALLIVVALGLTLVSTAAWQRSRNGRLLLLATGFGLFLASGIHTTTILYQEGNLQTALLWQTLLSAAGLLAIYLAAVKR